MARTGLLYRQEGLLHDTGYGHPECSARLDAIQRAFDAAGVDAPSVAVDPATRTDLLRIHTAEHIDTIERTCAHGDWYPDPDTPMVAASWAAALLAAGGAISACRAVLAGEVDNAFSAMRPPGHHAESDRPMGFCLFNNVAIAARWLQEEGQVNRVGILDWDVHHGNGTQNSFYDDGSILYVSLHESPLYPGTGHADEQGIDGTNLNLPIDIGSGPAEWLAAFDTHVIPALTDFAPDFLLISAGFDAHRLDPLAGQNLEAETYAEMTRRLRGLANGRVVSLLEGGYHLDALGASAVAHFRALESLE